MSDTAQPSRREGRHEEKAQTSSGKSSRRSDATRAAILAAARERFAADGYERATIRAIAKDAGIDPSMVMRYYGNKEGLFAAAAEIDLRMPDFVWSRTRQAPVPVHITRPSRAEARAEAEWAALGVGRVLVEHFLDMWETSEILTALLRVGVTNSSGAERMQEIFKEQLVPVAEQHAPDQESVQRRAALVASQMLGMALARYVLRFPPAVEMSREEVVDWLGPTVQRYLTATEA